MSRLFLCVTLVLLILKMAPTRVRLVKQGSTLDRYYLDGTMHSLAKLPLVRILSGWILGEGWNNLYWVDDCTVSGCLSAFGAVGSNFVMDLSRTSLVKLAASMVWDIWPGSTFFSAGQ